MSVAPGEASVAALLAAIADPAVVVGADGLVLGANTAARSLLGVAEGRPLAELGASWLKRARRVALSDAGQELVVWAPDEHGLAGDDVRLEKLDLLQRLAGAAEHELNNPLGALQGFAELFANDPSLPRDLVEMAGILGTAATKALLITRSYLALARGFIRAERSTTLADVVRGIDSLLGHPAINMDRRVTVPDTLPALDASLGTVQWILFAIVVNGLEAQGTQWTPGAAPGTGRLFISGRHIDDGRGNRVRISVEDGGPAVPADERATLFSGDGPGRATRDLAVVRVLVTDLGGRVSYEPVANGNRIAVELPVAGTTLPSDQEEPALSTDAAPPLVLVYDSQPFIRALLVRFLGRMGARTVDARDRQEAIAHLGQLPVDLVIAEFAADGTSRDLYDEAMTLRPDLATRFAIVSADPGNATVAEFAQRTGVVVTPKPFDEAQLRRLVRDATRR